MPLFDLERLKTLPGEELLTELERVAVTRGITDLHLHPRKNETSIEWRLDGILQTALTIDEAKYVAMQRRIKFNAKLKLNVTSAAQDGQYTFEIEGRIVNVRVATMPTRFGEAFTLRFLDPKRGIVPLKELGFPREIESSLEDLSRLPNGLILVTGPTGSGKTTTLYAILSKLSGKERNIITLEDPIEYELQNIVQSQVDPEHGYTFATGLRAVLRHDPDIILVGEIRDYETAQTAIDASLTGHLVLATLHTNSALEAIPRLLSMGVSPYTFAPALRGILAQRLVRRLKKGVDPKTADASDPSIYEGRIALPELLIASPRLRDLILIQAPKSDVEKAAKEEGFRTMLEWGDDLRAEGMTTREEILRVTA